MEGYQERVIKEKNDIDEKIGRLRKFINGSDKFTMLPLAEQRRLKRQKMIMELYSGVLRDRIEAF